jgi:hypothetical protein
VKGERDRAAGEPPTPDDSQIADHTPAGEGGFEVLKAAFRSVKK